MATISIRIESGIKLHPPKPHVSLGDIVTWSNQTDSTCVVGNFYTEGWLFPAISTLTPGEQAAAAVVKAPPSKQSKNIYYWCTPATNEEQASDGYDPAQGIIIVDPPGDGNGKPQKNKTRNR